jgi:hypothetical protein
MSMSNGSVGANSATGSSVPSTKAAISTPPSPPSTRSSTAFHRTTGRKAGLEFRPARYLALRAGFARHQSSQAPADRSPVYPDLDRNIYSFGFGYEGPLFSIWGDDEKVSDLSFDLFLRYASATPGQSAFPGYEMTYDSNRLVVGVGVGFIF